jgi:hypothetical protein
MYRRMHSADRNEEKLGGGKEKDNVLVEGSAFYMKIDRNVS